MPKQTDKTYDALTALFIKTKPVRATTKARLLIVVEYDETPEKNYLEDIVEKCREVGSPEVAIYEHLAPTWESLR